MLAKSPGGNKALYTPAVNLVTTRAQSRSERSLDIARVSVVLQEAFRIAALFNRKNNEQAEAVTASACSLFFQDLEGSARSRLPY